MNDDKFHIVTAETKARLSVYPGMGKIHTVFIGMTSCPHLFPFVSPDQPIYMMDCSQHYTIGEIKQILYN